MSRTDDFPSANQARHRALCEASRAAFTSPEFRQTLDDLKARCAKARRLTPRRMTDAEFDADTERNEGWALKPIGNVFA